MSLTKPSSAPRTPASLQRGTSLARLDLSERSAESPANMSFRTPTPPKQRSLPPSDRTVSFDQRKHAADGPPSNGEGITRSQTNSIPAPTERQSHYSEHLAERARTPSSDDTSKKWLARAHSSVMEAFGRTVSLAGSSGVIEADSSDSDDGDDVDALSAQKSRARLGSDASTGSVPSYRKSVAWGKDGKRERPISHTVIQYTAHL